jgi:predicted translin family RNA/ssDNA-binding protein
MDEEKEKLIDINRELRRQIKFMQDSLHYKNLQLDAMHYVWCSGGCQGGIHRWIDQELTEDMVAAAEQNVQRLRSWFINDKFRRQMFPERYK